MNRAFLSALMIVSLVSALVSPACAFMSGSTVGFIEICTSNGEIQTIAVPGQQAPSQQNGAQNAQPDCAFCFAATYMTPMAASDADLLALLSSAYVKVSSGTFIPLSLQARPYQSRAPPSVV